MATVRIADKDTLDAVKELTSAVQTLVNAINTNVNTVNTNVSSIKSTVGTINTNVSTVNSDVSTIKSEVKDYDYNEVDLPNIYTSIKKVSGQGTDSFTISGRGIAYIYNDIGSINSLIIDGKDVTSYKNVFRVTDYNLRIPFKTSITVGVSGGSYSGTYTTYNLVRYA